MRHVLIDRARKKQCARHGAGAEKLAIEHVDVTAPADDETLLAVNTALDELGRTDPVKAEVVKLKFFVGLSERETAELLGVSERTVERHWAYAQAWLFERLRQD